MKKKDRKQLRKVVRKEVRRALKLTGPLKSGLGMVGSALAGSLLTKLEERLGVGADAKKRKEKKTDRDRDLDYRLDEARRESEPLDSPPA